MLYILYIYIYILTIELQTVAAARMLTASGPGGPNHWSDSATNNSAAGTHSADAQLKVSLNIIS
jgi:cytoskeleton-associated protein 5